MDSEPADEGAREHGQARRRYDSPVRRERAALTRERILTAGSELVHEFTTWDWRGLTFRAVAERAGVGERTVYRYFATERELHDAVMRRLGEESGISYDNLSLDKMGLTARRLFESLPSYAIAHWDEQQVVAGTLLAEELRRRDAVAGAVSEPTSDWTNEESRMAAGVLDLLWSVQSYQRLLHAWGLDGEQATRAITWAIGVLSDAIRAGQRPLPRDAAAGEPPPGD